MLHYKLQFLLGNYLAYSLNFINECEDDKTVIRQCIAALHSTTLVCMSPLYFSFLLRSITKSKELRHEQLNMGFFCFECGLIVPGGVTKLLSHLHVAHALYVMKVLQLLCKQGGCPRTFPSFNSYRKHLVKQHNEQSDRDIPYLCQIDTLSRLY